ncbi:MarR family transcriptional regulator [Brachybacterium huguangmaarense]
MFVLHLSAPGRAVARAAADPVPALLDALAPLPWRLAPERTAGPEVLALASRADTVIAAVRAALGAGQWRLGIGVGPVDLRGGSGVREIGGAAVAVAREAHRDASVTSQVPVAVRATDPRQEATAHDAEAVLRLVGWMIRTRSAGQRRAVEAVIEHPRATQVELAGILGVTQQTVSRAIATSGWREESAAHPLAERLLAMIDLTSERTGPGGSAR